MYLCFNFFVFQIFSHINLTKASNPASINTIRTFSKQFLYFKIIFSFFANSLFLFCNVRLDGTTNGEPNSDGNPLDEVYRSCLTRAFAAFRADPPSCARFVTKEEVKTLVMNSESRLPLRWCPMISDACDKFLVLFYYKQLEQTNRLISFKSNLYLNSIQMSF